MLHLKKGGTQESNSGNEKAKVLKPSSNLKQGDFPTKSQKTGAKFAGSVSGGKGY